MRLHHNDTMYVGAAALSQQRPVGVARVRVLLAACVAIGRKFSASKFWDDVILNRATAFCYIGELCCYLAAPAAR